MTDMAEAERQKQAENAANYAEPPVPLGAGERHEIDLEASERARRVVCTCGQSWRGFDPFYVHAQDVLRTLLDESRAALQSAQKDAWLEADDTAMLDAELQKLSAFLIDECSDVDVDACNAAVGHAIRVIESLRATLRIRTAECAGLHQLVTDWEVDHQKVLNQLGVARDDLARVTAERDAAERDADDAYMEGFEHGREQTEAAAHAAGRREALMEACNALCELCRDGLTLDDHDMHVWRDGYPAFCEARRIRALLSEAT